MCHSPLQLHILQKVLSMNERTKLLGLRKIIQTNRDILNKALIPKSLIPIGSTSSSVEWVSLKRVKKNDLQVIEYLGTNGIHALPGKHFFWGQKMKHSNYIRFALLRDEEVLREAARKIEDLYFDEI